MILLNKENHAHYEDCETNAIPYCTYKPNLYYCDLRPLEVNGLKLSETSKVLLQKFFEELIVRWRADGLIGQKTQVPYRITDLAVWIESFPKKEVEKIHETVCRIVMQNLERRSKDGTIISEIKEQVCGL